MSPRPRAYEDDDEVVTIGAGSVDVSASGVEALGELLLDLTLGMLKVRVLLEEADEDVWKVLGPRLARVHDEISRLPSAPRPRRRIGYGPASKVKSKRR
jgi:hypothetical protein